MALDAERRPQIESLPPCGGLKVPIQRPLYSLVDSCAARIVENKLGDLGALKRIGFL